MADEKQSLLAKKTLPEAFMKARHESSLKWEGTAPSFHEIRSLSARLYTEEKGRDYAQKLLGHKSTTMTDKYRDVRGSEEAQKRLRVDGGTIISIEFRIISINLL